jgi:4-hydroxybenzoate polyprenyltransferase
LSINLLGPLGFIAGGLSSFAIGCAVLYNFYFKFTPLSPIPYAIAFAALPTCMAISKGKPIHPWMWLGGALFGMAAHFINVIKDIDEDNESGINGLPQLIGKKGSIFSSLALIVLGIIVVVGSQ